MTRELAHTLLHMNNSEGLFIHIDPSDRIARPLITKLATDCKFLCHMN